MLLIAQEARVADDRPGAQVSDRNLDGLALLVGVLLDHGAAGVYHDQLIGVCARLAILVVTAIIIIIIIIIVRRLINMITVLVVISSNKTSNTYRRACPPRPPR